MASIDDPGAFLERLVDAQWTTIARQAWQQYLQRGRGAIVFQLKAPGSEGTEPLRYLTFRDTDDDVTQSGLAKLHELVQTYAPQDEAVVAVVLPDERTVFDVYAKDPSPFETAPDAA
jgi:predicted ArsR family transcriptional regulator